MKEFFKWLVKNISNLFTVVGIILTVYFSIFYVPDYIRQNEDERVRSINSDLIEGIQEVIYNKHNLNEDKIRALIRGKELKLKTDYPFSIEELLLQTQDAFMSNKFIPLDERMAIINRIDSLRLDIITKSTETKIPDSTEKSESFLSVTGSNLFEILIGLLGALVSLLGSFSLLSKLRRERRQTIDDEVKHEKETIQESIKNALSFEEKVKEAIMKNSLDFMSGPSLGADFIVTNFDRRVFVEVKYLNDRKSLPPEFYHKFFQTLEMNNGIGILILNKKIDLMMPDAISNKFDKMNYHIIMAETEKELIEEFTDLIKNIANKR